ncbi:MAG: hypothetical protein HY695_23000 [Deltaproteobacteria bacterium]|nr:hypothetical protein [Deltaproteobacteria bacterium]
MNRSGTVPMAILFAFCFQVAVASAQEFKPVWGVTAFGGPQREGKQDDAHGIGGVELLGLAPLGQRLGVQGGFYLAGGRAFRFGVSGGPVFNFPSAKAGLFVDYEHREYRDGDFAAIRGSWASYFSKYNLELGYSQPVSPIQKSGGVKQAAINQLQGLLRFFPTQMLEFNAGMLLNSFAGPLRHENGGMGVGGILGFSFMPFEPLVINIVQAQFDNRERYKVTSSIQLAFGSTLQEWRKENVAMPTGGSAGGITTKKPKRCPDFPYCE